MYQKKIEKKKIRNWDKILLGTLFLFLLGGCKQERIYISQEDAAHQQDITGQCDVAQQDTTGQNDANQQNIVGQDGKEQSVAGQQDDTEAYQQEVGVYVHVTGAVVNPGVYQLPQGSRIFEAIALAGGVTEDADVASVNQAQIVSDGQMIYVYAIGEEGCGINERQSQEDGRVNLNTASVEQLMTLPGIGQAKAESIISFRETHGEFESVEDIMNIEGIKEGVFSKIEDHIKVN